MGTSSRWPGPGGRTGVAREWTKMSRRVSWRPERVDSLDSLEKKLANIAADHVAVLHRTMREDPSAFGLYEAAYAAGERLTTNMDIHNLVPDGLDGMYRPHIQRPLPFPEEGLAVDASLYSGGLDSLAWVARRTIAPRPDPLLLVTFEELNVSKEQQDVYECVHQRRRRRLKLLDHSQNVRGPGNGVRMERSTRSRGLLYAATAVHAAQRNRSPSYTSPRTANSPSTPHCPPAVPGPVRPDAPTR